MINNKNLKLGFTLVELMVFFMFISLVLAASTPIITKRLKNIPEKVYHGKYICLGGEHRYYNSTRLISSGAGCTFKPPRKAALYKIEMIGGGAGGYEYIRDPWDDTEDREATYDPKNRTKTGDAYAFPNGSQLQQILYGVAYRFATTTGSGGSGGDVQVSYTGTTSPQIEFTGECYNEGEEVPEGSTMISCAEKDERISKAYHDLSPYSGSCTTSSGKWCHYVADSSLSATMQGIVNSYFPNGDAILKSYSTADTATGYGSYGGSSKRIYIDGTINFRNKDGVRVSANETESYLYTLFNSAVKKGSTSSPGSCAGWSNSSPTSTSAPDINYNDTHITSAEDGTDVERYGALKVWDTYCVTNKVRPTGGKGGYISQGSSRWTGTYSWYYDDSTDAAGPIQGSIPSMYQMTTGITDSASDYYPTVKVKTNLNNRYHQVGSGGGAARTATYYVPALDDDCVFGVASGGPAIDDTITLEEIESLQRGLSTTLVCNGGSLKLSVDGGTYYNVPSEPKVFPGFELVNGDGTFKSVSPYETSVSGAGSPYQSSDVYTKYDLGIGGFGAGGASNSIKDTCTTPYGYYSFAVVSNGSTINQRNYDIPYDGCDPVESITRTEATDGTGGVIIITW